MSSHIVRSMMIFVTLKLVRAERITWILIAIIIVICTCVKPHLKFLDIFAYSMGLRQELVYASTWERI